MIGVRREHHPPERTCTIPPRNVDLDLKFKLGPSGKGEEEWIRPADINFEDDDWQEGVASVVQEKDGEWQKRIDAMVPLPVVSGVEEDAPGTGMSSMEEEDEEDPHPADAGGGP